jgi:DNA repair exonuclease SbcCD ATPase subunit
MSNLNSLIERTHKLTGMKQTYQSLIDEVREAQKHTEAKLQILEQTLFIFQEVATMVQDKMVYHISEVSNLALDAIFENPYKLSIYFEIKRNQSECYILFSKGEEKKEIDPLNASGGGVVDIVSYSLRVSLWSIKSGSLIPVIMFDEPLKNLSENYQNQAGQILREVCKKLGLQIIMVTHIGNYIGFADNQIKIGIENGVSKTLKN